MQRAFEVDTVAADLSRQFAVKHTDRLRGQLLVAKQERGEQHSRHLHNQMVVGRRETALVVDKVAGHVGHACQQFPDQTAAVAVITRAFTPGGQQTGGGHP